MTNDHKEFCELLDACREHGVKGLNDLLAEDLEWLRRFIHAHLSDGLRTFCTTNDLVQETAIEVMKFIVKVRIENRRQWRGLLAQITLNVIRSRARGFNAMRKGGGLVRHELDQDIMAASVTDPGDRAANGEERENLRLAILLLEEEDAKIVTLYLEGKSDKEIGQEIETSGNTARTKRVRAIQKLPQLADEISSGKIGRRYESIGSE